MSKGLDKVCSCSVGLWRCVDFLWFISGIKHVNSNFSEAHFPVLSIICLLAFPLLWSSLHFGPFQLISDENREVQGPCGQCTWWRTSSFERREEKHGTQCDFCSPCRVNWSLEREDRRVIFKKQSCLKDDYTPGRVKCDHWVSHRNAYRIIKGSFYPF